VAIGDNPADEREEHDRQLLQECVEAQKKRRGGQRQREHQPVFGQALHPGADARGAGAEPEDAEIAVMQRGSQPPESFGGNCSVGFDGGGRRVRLSQRIVPEAVS
jgi:hypothetical protein